MIGNPIEEAVREALEAAAPQIEEIAPEIHGFAELGFKEFRASALLKRILGKAGFAVEAPVAGLETAFVAEHGSDEPRICFLAEYDALPEIGHACGHNIIAAMSVGAGLIVRRVLERQGLRGKVAVVGSPAEEGGGGKVFLGDAGVFQRYDAAMMLHPADQDSADPPILARDAIEIRFHGRASHAAMAPEQGIDALAAAVNYMMLINSMRETLRKDANIHSVITDGGQAQNIIAEHAAVRTSVRARDREYMEILLKRTLACADGAAAAVGATMAWERTSPPYYELRSNPWLLGILEEEMRAEGHESHPSDDVSGSTDMGNVSHLLPSIHGMISIASRGTANHTRAFAEAASTAEARRHAMAGARILARTALAVLTAPDWRDRLNERTAH